jgi:pimeloyl-ACP methyl ester carboxylesterase
LRLNLRDFDVNANISRRHAIGLLAAAPMMLSEPSWARSRGVDETGFARIGGIEQWVAIRGRDRLRVAMLFLHGGPGDAQSPFLSVFTPWEKRYVAAQWDQRGAGKTFGKNGTSTPNMTLEQMAQDCVEVTRYVLRQLGVRKLILVGHSWGSILGLSAVRLRPELFHAFVGTGQIVSCKNLVEMWRLSAVARARTAGDAQAVAELNGLSALDFTDMAKLGLLFKWQPPFAGSDTSYIDMQGRILGSPSNPTSPEAADWYSGKLLFSIPKLMRSFIDFDAAAAGYDLPVPFFVIQGRDDSRTPPEAARAFVNRVLAPVKGYTAIEGGHFACFTNPAGFLNALDSNIRTLGDQVIKNVGEPTGNSR